jgi:hypothetical protein
MYVTPFQARKYLTTFTNYLIQFKSQATSKTFISILRITADNARYTKATIGTNIDQATSGNIKITESGLYTYTIWGQNSTTNLDPADDSVVGECEVGVLQVIGAEAWTIPVISIPNNVVYYE